MKHIGYQDDPAAAEKEAKALMAAAGYKDGIKGLDYLVRDLASYHVWSQAIQAMLQQTLNITCNRATWWNPCGSTTSPTGTSTWRWRGGVDAAGSVRLLQRVVPHRRPAELLVLQQPRGDELIEQIDREVDPAKRQELIRQSEAIFEQDPPLLPVAWEKIDDVWYDYVKGLRPDDYFGAYDVCRQDTFWLDKT